MKENEKKVVDIRDRYYNELANIDYLLRGLEEGRIYGYNGNVNKFDGTLQTNAKKLRKEISSLLTKIEYDKKSITEELGEALANFEL